MSIWKWSEWLVPVPAEHRVTLGEGNTPLVKSRSIGPAVGVPGLYFKLETCNPTGSYKDRFAAVAISHARAAGKSRCIATSSGNTGAALAAYCAASGMQLDLAVVESAPAEKLRQVQAYGGRPFRIRGFGRDPVVDSRVFAHLRERGSSADSVFLISAYRHCPEGMSGLKTISYELAEQLPDGVDQVFCCAGSGGLVVGVARGFADLAGTGRLAKRPAVECVQPMGNATISGPLRRGADRPEPVECTTRISGLQVPSLIDGEAAFAVVRETGGNGHVVGDEETWAVQSRLAREEGVFAEPAGTVPLAGFLRAAAEGLVRRDAVVVCLVTGSGFKDAAALDRMVTDRDCPFLTPEEVMQPAFFRSN